MKGVVINYQPDSIQKIPTHQVQKKLFKKLCLKNKGILFSDKGMEIGVITDLQQAQVEQKCCLIINLYYTNISDFPMAQFSVKFFQNTCTERGTPLSKTRPPTFYNPASRLIPLTTRPGLNSLSPLAWYKLTHPGFSQRLCQRILTAANQMPTISFLQHSAGDIHLHTHSYDL